MIAAILLNSQFKSQDFQYPLSQLKKAGCAVAIIASELKTYYSQEKQPAEPDMMVSDIDPEKFDLLIIPVQNSRLDTETIKLIQEFNRYNNTIAIIGSSNDFLKQVKIAPDSQKNIFFSENTQDLSAFMAKIMEKLAKRSQ